MRVGQLLRAIPLGFSRASFVFLFFAAAIPSPPWGSLSALVLWVVFSCSAPPYPRNPFPSCSSSLAVQTAPYAPKVTGREQTTSATPARVQRPYWLIFAGCLFILVIGLFLFVTVMFLVGGLDGVDTVHQSLSRTWSTSAERSACLALARARLSSLRAPARARLPAATLRALGRAGRSASRAAQAAGA